MVFREGIKGWIRANYTLNKEKALPSSKISRINADQLKKIINDVTVLDIRPEHLYTRGQINNSLKITMEDLSKRHTEIPKKNRIIVVDHLGKQAPIACKFLISKGFKDVYALEEGLMPLFLRGFSLQQNTKKSL